MITRLGEWVVTKLIDKAARMSINESPRPGFKGVPCGSCGAMESEGEAHEKGCQL